MKVVKKQQNKINEFFKNHDIDIEKEDKEFEDELNNLISSIQKEEGFDLSSANKEELTNDNEEKNKKKKNKEYYRVK